MSCEDTLYFLVPLFTLIFTVAWCIISLCRKLPFNWHPWFVLQLQMVFDYVGDGLFVFSCAVILFVFSVQLKLISTVSVEHPAKCPWRRKVWISLNDIFLKQFLNFCVGKLYAWGLRWRWLQYICGLRWKWLQYQNCQITYG